MAGLDLDTSDPKEQRKFGLLMAAAISVLGMIRWGLHWWREGHQPESLPMAFFAVAAIFLMAGVVWPRALQPAFVVWMKFAVVMNFLVTHILLTIVFFTMIIPARAIVAVLRKDLLNAQWPPKAGDTYWEEPEEQPKEFERYLNQF